MIQSFGKFNSNKFSDYQVHIMNTLSSYTEVIAYTDGSVEYKTVESEYFLNNDVWNIHDLGKINNFKMQYEKYTDNHKNIRFRFTNKLLKLEMKYFVYMKLFSTEWSIRNAFSQGNNTIKTLSDFFNEVHPEINCFADANIDKLEFQWIDFLNRNNLQTIQYKYHYPNGIKYSTKSIKVTCLRRIYSELVTLIDIREEWLKDKWNVRNLEKYGVSYNYSRCDSTLDFSKVKNIHFKELLKQYIKKRILGGNRLSWSEAISKAHRLRHFLNFISEIEPNWTALNDLTRNHMEKYFESLNVFIRANALRKDSNPEKNFNKYIGTVATFIEESQLYELSYVPTINVKKLVLPIDRQKTKNMSSDSIKYVPDYVLDQLMQVFNKLNPESQPIALVMLYTGLRISDALTLKHDCLMKINGSYWIETDIMKTKVKNHRIPIDEKLANILAVLIDKSKRLSNKDNNPNNYIFCRYLGIRKGKPYIQSTVRTNLNTLAREYNIVDESGNIFHFNNHCFRHTYAVTMLNNGVDILILQELLAHASPEMTMRYAKLLDNTKRKAFDKAVKQGVFSFDIDGKLHDETNDIVPNEVLDMLWANHKLNAIDTPYGTCLQRSKGKCAFARQPPCLTCNSGNPCKNLGVGIFEGDINKYEIHINSTKALIGQAKVFHREDMAKENEELLSLYEEIYNTIINGNIVYGRLERLTKQGEINE